MRNFVLTKYSALKAIDDLVREGFPVLERVLARLPRGFPSGIAESIAEGFRTRLRQLDRGREGAGRGGG